MMQKENDAGEEAELQCLPALLCISQIANGCTPGMSSYGDMQVPGAMVKVKYAN